MTAIKYKLPAGILTDFMLHHINTGHAALGRSAQSRLFTSNTGKDFVTKKATFNYFWDTVLSGKWCPMLPAWQPFKPSLGRTMFVEHVTSQTGYQPDLWDGPARCMGSSAKQWALHYAPGMHARQMQAAADSHHQWGVRAVAPPGAGAVVRAPPAGAGVATRAPPSGAGAGERAFAPRAEMAHVASGSREAGMSTPDMPKGRAFGNRMAPYPSPSPCTVAKHVADAIGSNVDVKEGGGAAGVAMHTNEGYAPMPMGFVLPSMVPAEKCVIDLLSSESDDAPQ